jgi:acetyl-CoA carboxylase carboxyl transferase subunit beta
MFNDLFKKSKYGTVKKVSQNTEEKPNIPSGMWVKCDDCGGIIYNEDLVSNCYVCPSCNNHLRITAETRINTFFDKGSFVRLSEEVKTANPLDFNGYKEKVQNSKKSTSSSEAVITGIGTINGIKVASGVMDSYFMMGSMGTAVGERLATLIENATKNRLPLIIFTTSGGARMQEGIYSLMQMAKVSAAIAKHDDAGLLYITVITNPTTGGVTASFAMEGDIIISEPKALIGFAGRRVIENTIKENLPDDFQKAEFLLKKGFVDAIIDRRNLRKEIYNILSIHEVRNFE